MSSAVVSYWVVEGTWSSVYRAVLDTVRRMRNSNKTNLRTTVFRTFWQFVFLVRYFELHGQLNSRHFSTTVHNPCSRNL